MSHIKNHGGWKCWRTLEAGTEGLQFQANQTQSQKQTKNKKQNRAVNMA
jgi:hypothetical protein